MKLTGLKTISLIAITAFLCNCGTFNYQSQKPSYQPTILWEEGNPEVRVQKKIRNWQERVKKEGGDWWRECPKVEYREQIRAWKERINREGWTEKTIDEIVKECKKHMIPESEKPEDTPEWYRQKGDEWKGDYWKTPKEVTESEFKTDCEDRGSFILGTFRILGYPKDDVRMLGMMYTPRIGLHILSKIKLPNGNWKIYKTVDIPFLQLFRRYPVVEWNEDKIWVYPQGEVYGLRPVTLEEIKRKNAQNLEKNISGQ